MTSGKACACWSSSARRCRLLEAARERLPLFSTPASPQTRSHSRPTHPYTHTLLQRLLETARERLPLFFTERAKEFTGAFNIAMSAIKCVFPSPPNKCLTWKALTRTPRFRNRSWPSCASLLQKPELPNFNPLEPINLPRYPMKAELFFSCQVSHSGVDLRRIQILTYKLTYIHAHTRTRDTGTR